MSAGQQANLRSARTITLITAAATCTQCLMPSVVAARICIRGPKSAVSLLGLLSVPTKLWNKSELSQTSGKDFCNILPWCQMFLSGAKEVADAGGTIWAGQAGSMNCWRNRKRASASAGC